MEVEEHYNPYISPFMDIVDSDNGDGYSKNIHRFGNFISIPDSNTKMLYEVKTLEGARIVFIRYIHYDNVDELLNLLAFACQWWTNLKPSMIYMREKSRPNDAGRYLIKLGFKRTRIPNELKPFDCNIDGVDCHCPVYEYCAYGVVNDD